MYSTCLHCQHDLGRNALIEHLPVGRRIAFDADTGRLWVVCGHCARWNLVPFESRWEAIESGERLYRSATQRMSTGEIGLARTREGTELVRIGAPLRPEMAAWRYGAQFVRRQWKYASTIGPASMLLASAPLIIGLTSSIRGIVLPGYALIYLTGYLHHRLIGGKTHGVLPLADEHTFLTRYMVSQLVVEPDREAGVQLWLPIMTGRVEDDTFVRGLFNSVAKYGTLLASSLKLTGVPEYSTVLPSHFTRVPQDDHARILRAVLPLLHEAGARSSVVREATTLLDDHHGNARDLLFGGRSAWNVQTEKLRNIRRPRRLALEMLVHEDSERRWLAGDLLDLEAEWRRANEIAAIADALLRDPAIEARLDAVRGIALPPRTETS